MTILPFIIVFVVALTLTELLRRYALKHSLLDVPNARSSHELPTPRGGGAAIVASFLLGLTITWYFGVVNGDLFVALIGAGSVVAVIGFLDDYRHVPRYQRLVVHFVAAIWALWWMGEVPPIQLHGSVYWPGVLIMVAAPVFLVWLLNLFNFMDGIDGLAGSEVVFVAVSGAVLTWLIGSKEIAYILLILAVTASGFLVLNWPPAKIFMGDVGSGFLGITLGILAYASILDGVSSWSWLILFGVFLVDASVTLLRRILRKARWYEAHRSHAYQWAARSWGHLHVSIAVNVINLLWLLPLAYLAHIYSQWGWAVLLTAYIPLVFLALKLGAGRAEENCS